MASGVSEDKPDFLFTIPSYEDWLITARQELDGADPIEKLTVRKGEFEIFPFYDASKKIVSNNSLKPSLNPFNGSRSWINSPKILATDESKANKFALSCLNAGAEGILFDCTTEINPHVLLENISLIDCSISFLIHPSSPTWLEKIIDYAENNFEKKEIKGAIYWKNVTELNAALFNRFSTWSQFYSLGVVVDSHSQASDEIASALSKAVGLAESHAKERTDLQSILNQIAFSISVGNDFFLEIAKIKSLRSLWHQVRGAYSVSIRKPLIIHAISNAWIHESFQPHGNMIKSTTAAMAAIAGGCDSLTIEPEDSNHETMNRIAMNVSTILREESHFSKVADPTAGSYYIDSLTNQLSEKAWQKFQTLVK